MENIKSSRIKSVNFSDIVKRLVSKEADTTVAEPSRNKEVRKIVANVVDCYFLFLVSFTSFCTQIRLTTFYCNPWYKFYKYLYIIAVGATLLKIALFYKKRVTWASIPFAVVFYLAFPISNYEYEAFFSLFLIGCTGIKLRKILCAVFFPSALVIINMMIASLGGAIYSMATLSRNMRSYWGHISPTDFGASILWIVTFIWILFENLPDEVFLLPSLFSLFISFYITHSNTSGYLTIIFMVILALMVVIRVINNETKVIKGMRKIMNVMMFISFPLLGFLTIAVVYAYYKELPYTGELDVLFHNRFSVPAKLIAKYGIKPFGTFFYMRGNGGSVFLPNAEYTFIDSSYPQILIRYGWVTYIAAIVLWCYTIWKAIKTDNRRWAYVMTIFALDFVMEHHWYEVCYNVFLLIPFADFAGGEVELHIVREFKSRWTVRLYKLVFVMVAAGIAVACVVLLPVFFSWLRTIFNGYGLYGGGRKGIIVFGIITVIVFSVISFLWSVSWFTADIIAKNKHLTSCIIILGVSSIILLTGLLMGNVLINRIAYRNADRINSEKDLLKLISENAKGKVYVDKLPEAYKRKIVGIERSLFNGEDYARYDEVTVVTDASWDSVCLSLRGFLYLEISEDDAIYTNDEMVIKILNDNGYKLKGYNSHTNEVDLLELARINDLIVTEDGSLELVGDRNEIIQGPYINLYSGKYTVDFKMKLMDSLKEKDTEVCSIRVTAYEGEKVLAEAKIKASDFDEYGQLSYELPFIGKGPKCEFMVSVNDGIGIEISSLTYRRIPDVDIHRRVDNKGRIIRQEYYDLDGNPKEMANGYYGIENSYDDRDLKIMERYLGEDMNPVCISAGYSEVHREYDIKKQLVKESYYDVAGEPICRSTGEQSVQRKYDFDGNVISISYYGLTGEPVIYNETYHEVRKRYDDKKKCIHEEYYDNYGMLCEQSLGYYGLDKKYDKAGNVIIQIYLDKEMEPVIISRGYAIWHRTYDELKQVIREEYYDVDGSKMRRPTGQFAVEHEYDAARNCISDSYYGLDNERIIITSGYWKVVREYNTKKKVIRERFYGIDEKPSVKSNLFVSIMYSYDGNDKLIKKTYMDINENIVKEKIME